MTSRLRALSLGQLANARLLVESGQREAAQRRAVSTAYFAVFQSLCEICAHAAIGAEEHSKAFNRFYRSFDHGAVQTALKVANEYLDLEWDLDEEYGPLRKARERAAYSPEPRPNSALAHRASSGRRSRSRWRLS